MPSFNIAHELRMFFIFFTGWGKNTKEYCYIHLKLHIVMYINYTSVFKKRLLFHGTGKLYEIQIPMFIDKVLVECSMLIHLHKICGCFCATLAELSTCN